MPSLKRDAQQGARSSSGIVWPCVRVAISLRMLAGGSVWDLMAIFGVGRTTVYHVFHSTLDAIYRTLSLPGIPVNDPAALTATAEGFKTSRASKNPLYGCVAAIDGIAIRIRSPRAIDLPSLYYCRKGYFALPVQACCDSKYRFLYFSAKAVGSTHDSLAFSISSLHTLLESGSMPDGFWIAGDAAYTCTDYMLTPFSKTMLLVSGFQTCRDAYNFYQSSHRVHIEQAFGMLVDRQLVCGA
jgi:DDE superfamily endonuclease